MINTDIFKLARKPLETISSKLAPIAMKASAHSPEILLGCGIAAMAGGMVSACITTYRKLPNRIEDRRCELIRSYGNGSAPAEDKAQSYIKMAGKVAMDYAPSIILFGSGVLMTVSCRNKLRSRLGAVSAAYMTLEGAYADYRTRVVDEYGEEVDRKFRLGIFDEEETRTKKLKNGKEKEVTEMVETVHPDGTGYSMYARYFDAFNSDMFVRDQEANFDFLRVQQNIANEKLQRRGYLFLNEVYEALGFQAVPEGQLVGWVKGLGDFVDFGLFEVRNADVRDFVNNPYDNPDCFVLDFNVDGVMWDLI